MDTLWYLRYKRDGGQSAPMAWEIAAGLDDWQKAPVPAQVGKRLAEAYLGRELPAESAQLTTNVMHWGYGLFWGSLYGILVGSTRVRSALVGLPFGAGVWAAGYVMLPLGKFYKPIWKYDLRTLWKDLSAHLVYGVTTAASFAVIHRSRPA